MMYYQTSKSYKKNENSLEATASKGINFKFVVMVMMTRGSTHKRRLLEPLY